MARKKSKPTHVVALTGPKYGYPTNTIFNAVERREHGYLIEWKIFHPQLGLQTLLPCETKVLKKLHSKNNSKTL